MMIIIWKIQQMAIMLNGKMILLCIIGRMILALDAVSIHK